MGMKAKVSTAVAAAATALFMTVGAASAATLDFNGATPCTSTDAFVTLSTVGTTVCSATVAPTTGSGAVGLTRPGLVTGLSAMRADFGGLVGFVSIDLGDYNADADNIFLEVFNSSNVSLGYVDLLRAGSSFAMDTLSIATAGIAYAIFGTNNNDLGYIAADNLTWRAQEAVVPLPAALPLMLVGLGGLGALGMRRKKA